MAKHTHNFTNSSNIAKAAYDDSNSELTITFKNKNGQSDYTYTDVPKNVYTGMTIAPSAGKYFFANIKGKFTSKAD